MIIVTSIYDPYFFWLSDGWRSGGSVGYQTRNDVWSWIMTSSLRSIHGFHWWWINIQYLYSFQPPDGVNGADKYESVSDILLQALIISLIDTAGHGSCRIARTRISNCVTQLMLYTGDKVSSSIFCCLWVCQASVTPDQISTFSNIYSHTSPLLTMYHLIPSSTNLHWPNTSQYRHIQPYTYTACLQYKA